MGRAGRGQGLGLVGQGRGLALFLRQVGSRLEGSYTGGQEVREEAAAIRQGTGTGSGHSVQKLFYFLRDNLALLNDLFVRHVFGIRRSPEFLFAFFSIVSQ